MSQKLTVLDRVSVGSPCQEKWDEMVGNDTVRACSHCSHTVHNLSSLTRAEAEKLVAESKGRICISYLRGPQGQILTKDTLPAPVVPFGKLGSLATGAFALAAGIAVSTAPTPVQAQEKPAACVRNDSGKGVISVKPNPNGQTTLSVVVRDPEGNPLRGAYLSLLDLASKERTTGLTDKQGTFSCAVKPNCLYELRVSDEDLATWKDQISTRPGMETTIQIRMIEAVEEGRLTGMMVIHPPSGWFLYTEGKSLVHIRAAKESNDFLLAVLEGNEKEVGRMLANRTLVNTRNRFGDSALMHAIFADSALKRARYPPHLVKLLLAAGAAVSHQNKFGITALMLAVLGNHKESVQLLLAASADVNMQDQNGRTALMYAAVDGNDELVSLLLAHGAQPNLKDKEGRTALHYAVEQQADKVIVLLK